MPTKQTWDQEYRDGDWVRLQSLSEQAHNGVLLIEIAHLFPDASILEVGCGDGVLLRRLKQIGYRNYLGFDISEVAIEKSRDLEDSRTRLLVADAEDYAPSGTFDVILLNESIYYFKRPIETVQRYARHLNPKGILALSLFDHMKTRPIIRELKTAFSLVDETTVSNAKGCWRCLVMNDIHS